MKNAAGTGKGTTTKKKTTGSGRGKAAAKPAGKASSARGGSTRAKRAPKAT